MRRLELQLFVGTTFIVALVIFQQLRSPSPWLDTIPTGVFGSALEIYSGAVHSSSLSSRWAALSPFSCFFHRRVGDPSNSSSLRQNSKNLHQKEHQPGRLLLAPVEVWTLTSLGWPPLAAPCSNLPLVVSSKTRRLQKNARNFVSVDMKDKPKIVLSCRAVVDCHSLLLLEQICHLVLSDDVRHGLLKTKVFLCPSFPPLMFHIVDLFKYDEVLCCHTSFSNLLLSTLRTVSPSIGLAPPCTRELRSVLKAAIAPYSYNNFFSVSSH